MTPWKVFLSLLVLLLPGGSLVLVAIAVAKALRHTRDRALVPVPVVARRAVYPRRVWRR